RLPRAVRSAWSWRSILVKPGPDHADWPDLKGIFGRPCTNAPGASCLKSPGRPIDPGLRADCPENRRLSPRKVRRGLPTIEDVLSRIELKGPPMSAAAASRDQRGFTLVELV